MSVTKKAAKVGGTLAALDVAVKIGGAIVAVVVAYKAIKALTSEQ